MDGPTYGLHYESGRMSRGRALLISVLLGIGLGMFLFAVPELLGRDAPPQATFLPAGERSSMVDESLARSLLELPSATSTPVRNAPAFLLPDLFEENIWLRLADYQGKPVILNFWASWCVPCRQEMPALQQVHDRYKDDGLVLLGINQTYIDDLQLAREFVIELGLTFPSARDDTGATSEEAYRVVGLPTSFFITPEGKIAQLHIGQMSEDQIEMLVKKYFFYEESIP